MALAVEQRRERRAGQSRASEDFLSAGSDLDLQDGYVLQRSEAIHMGNASLLDCFVASLLA